MALPKLATPEYTLKLPSNNMEVKYRPFLVKEEKILLMAVESGNESQMTNAISSILEDCVDFRDGTRVKDLPTFDVEYLFLNLRAKSIGETIKVVMPCKNCKNDYTLNIDIESVKMNMVDDHDSKIQLTEEIGVVMKYPTFGMTIDESTREVITKDPVRLVNSCIDKIYDSDKVYNAKDYSDSDLNEFVESLNQDQFLKIQKFFETMPSMKHDASFTCGKCDTRNELVLESIQDFFV
tara:strand:- start:38554 stop:39264 length:711 start_codon:yes stop_codon:yes gene_type:complete